MVQQVHDANRPGPRGGPVPPALLLAHHRERPRRPPAALGTPLAALSPMPICALLCARQCEACVRGMPPDEKGRPYNGEYCAACGQDCQSMVISQQNIAQQNSEIQDVLLSRSQERIIKTALDRVRAGSPLCARAAPRPLRAAHRCAAGRANRILQAQAVLRPGRGAGQDDVRARPRAREAREREQQAAPGEQEADRLEQVRPPRSPERAAAALIGARAGSGAAYAR